MDAAILAGGRARRFGGRNKSALRIGRASVMDRQLDALRGLAGRVFVVADARSRFASCPVEVVADLLPGAGALGGIYTALSAAASECVLVLACDLPFVSAALLGRLAGLAAEGWDAVVPRSPDGLQPLCAVYARRVMPVIRQRIDSHRLRVADLFGAIRAREFGPDEIAACDPDGRLFFNVNTPDDLERAVRLAARAERPRPR